MESSTVVLVLSTGTGWAKFAGGDVGSCLLPATQAPRGCPRWSLALWSLTPNDDLGGPPHCSEQIPSAPGADGHRGRVSRPRLGMTPTNCPLDLCKTDIPSGDAPTLHPRPARPPTEPGRPAHHDSAGTTDAVLQPVGFWQWMPAAVLVAVPVAGATLLSTVGAVIVCAATSIRLVATTVRSYVDVLPQAALALPLLVSAMVPAGITLVLT